VIGGLVIYIFVVVIEGEFVLMRRGWEFKGIILARSVSKLPDRLLWIFRDPHIKHSRVETRFLAWFHAGIATAANRVRTLLIAETIVFLG